MTERLALGTELSGRYRLRTLLDTSGASADIYLADDSHLGQRVVVKVMRLDYAQVSTHMERFAREQRMLTDIQSPHVYRLLDKGIHEGYHWYAGEYFPRSETLRSFIAKYQQSSCRIPVAIVHKLGMDLARAMLGFHEDAHRDLKPGNLLVVRVSPVSPPMWEEPEDYRLVVLDFGLAKGEGDQTLTASDGACGTSGYISPEVLRGESGTHLVDLFAWGIIMCEMLAGRGIKRPFDPASLREYRPAREVNPWIPILQQQLNDDPAERMEAPELIDALRALDGRKSKVVIRRRSRARWPMAAALVCGIAGGAAATAWLLNDVGAPTATETPAQPAVAAATQTNTRTHATKPPSTPKNKRRDRLTKKPTKKQRPTEPNKDVVVYDLMGAEMHVPDGTNVEITLQ